MRSSVSTEITRLLIDDRHQRAQRAPSIAYIDGLWAGESEGDRQVTDRRNQHRLMNDTSVSDECNRQITGAGYALQQIFLTTGAIRRLGGNEEGRWGNAEEGVSG